MFNIKNINHRNNGVVVILLVLLSIVFSSCSSDDNPTIPINIAENPIEAGPILFITGYTSNYRLYSMQLDGSDAKELISLPENYITSASWSPNGESIVFRAGYKDPSKAWETVIFTMDKYCHNIKRLNTEYFHTDYYSGGYPPFVWSPDSRKIAYTKLWRPEASGYYDIFTYDLTTNTEKQISSDDEYSDHVVGWTHDGKYLVSSSNQGYHDRFIAYYNTSNGELEKEYHFKDTVCMVKKISNLNEKMLTFVSFEQQNYITVFDPVHNSHDILLNFNDNIRDYRIVDWNNSKNEVLVGSYYGEHYDNSTFAIYEYAIYDLEGNLIQKIENPLGDEPFHIVSWRMD